MAFVVKTAKTVRNHWKKSTFASICLAYGFDYARNSFKTQELMRVYCEKASRYGDQPIRVDLNPKRITIILNPTANKRKANDEFEQYCAPILHLAGIHVDVIKTESEGHAKTLIDDLQNTDALVVAGGDGTLSEVITGLLRRTQENTDGLIPIGVLPLGQTNTLAQKLFLFSNAKVEKVRALAEATMAVVEEAVKPIDVLRIEVLEGESKPIYAVSGVKWGAYRDAESKKDSYWIYGKFRKYATYIFNGYKNGLTWRCDADISYSPPCEGCSNCIRPSNQSQKWYQRFGKAQQLSASKILNPECQNIEEKSVSTVDFNLNVAKDEGTPKLEVKIGPRHVNYFGFVQDGWRSANGEQRSVKEIIDARSVQVRPKNLGKDENEAWFSIDNEQYEVKPIRVTLLPKLINIFCKKDIL